MITRAANTGATRESPSSPWPLEPLEPLEPLDAVDPLAPAPFPLAFGPSAAVVDGERPCVVFSQNDGAAMICQKALMAAIDIITQYRGIRQADHTSDGRPERRAARIVR